MGIIKKYDLECDFCKYKFSENYNTDKFELKGHMMEEARELGWDYKKLKGIQQQKWRCPECVKQMKGE
jgi:hypothetical protein